MSNLNPTKKGVVTGILMVAAGLALFFTKTGPTSAWQYISYFIFGLGIVWAISGYAHDKGSIKFGELFNQGFRCFVVVALIMALYTLIFYKANSRLIEEKGELTRQELLKTEKNRTPAEIDEMVKNGKKYFIPMAASVTIFQYLLIGVIVSSATAGIISITRKN